MTTKKGIQSSSSQEWLNVKSSAATSISYDIVNITDVDLAHEEDTDLKM
jgi:hypothetical protein